MNNTLSAVPTRGSQLVYRSDWPIPIALAGCSFRKTQLGPAGQTVGLYRPRVACQPFRPAGHSWYIDRIGPFPSIQLLELEMVLMARRQNEIGIGIEFHQLHKVDHRPFHSIPFHSRPDGRRTKRGFWHGCNNELLGRFVSISKITPPSFKITRRVITQLIMYSRQERRRAMRYPTIAINQF